MSNLRTIAIVTDIRDGTSSADSRRKDDDGPLRHLQGIADAPQVERMASDDPRFVQAVKYAVAKALGTTPRK